MLFMNWIFIFGPLWVCICACVCLRNLGSTLYTVSYCGGKIGMFLYFLMFFKKILIDTEYFVILVGQNICKILSAIYIFSFYNIKINACFQNLFTVQYKNTGIAIPKVMVTSQFCHFSLGLSAILVLSFLLCKIEMIIVLTTELVAIEMRCI